MSKGIRIFIKVILIWILLLLLGLVSRIGHNSPILMSIIALGITSAIFGIYRYGGKKNDDSIKSEPEKDD